jgi:hypothetical protein
MANYNYSITYCDPLQFEDESAYIDVKTRTIAQLDPPLAREGFMLSLARLNPSPWLQSLFAIPGVVGLGVWEYRVWVMKSPVFNWTEVMVPVITYLSTGYSTAVPLPGSANTDGTGKRFSVNNQQTMGLRRF